MTEYPFAHLHTHSEHSLIDGAAHIGDMVNFAATDGNIGIALTDHGVPSGTVELFKACQDVGIQALPGLEAYHIPDWKDRKRVSDLYGGEGKTKNFFHLTLLAINMDGYRNINKLTEISNIQQRYRKPLVDDKVLAEHSAGIIATSGCIGSFINQMLLSNRPELRAEADAALERFLNIYEGRFYLELADHGIPEQESLNRQHLQWHKEKGLPLFAANDAHYMTPEDSRMHDAKLCVRSGSKLDDPDRFKFSSHENYMKTAQQMYELFPDDVYPDACRNTAEIVKMADGLDIFAGKKYLIPSFDWERKVDHIELDRDKYNSEDEMFRFWVEVGALSHYGLPDGSLPKEVRERIDYEVGVIENLKFVSYFLLTADFVAWAKKNGYRVGPGRGSGAGSIVAYCMSITEVEPLSEGLYFERFLNPGRASMPDFDIDFEPDAREPVVDYLVERYGADRVARIGTFQKMKGRQSIKDAARVLGFPPSLGDEITKLYPKDFEASQAPLSFLLHGDPESDDGKRFKRHYEGAKKLRAKYQQDPQAREAMDIACLLEGYIRGRGMHAAAVVITPTAASDYLPLVPTTKKDVDMPMSAYFKDDVEFIGGLKVDLLGLSNLSIIKTCEAIIAKDLGEVVDSSKVSRDDTEVFKMLAEGDTDGVFQLESPGMRDLLKRLKPTRFSDIPAVVALYRPGPMGSDLHTKYADVKNGREKASAPHKDFHKLFADTHSVLCYQEQLIRLATYYAGFNESEADIFRKATSKKQKEVLDQQEKLFKEGALKNGFDKKSVDDIWEIIPPFSSYSFNKSHAVAYSYVTYQTAWLKRHYPAQFLAACIAHMSRERIPSQIVAAKKRDIKVHPPRINTSSDLPVTYGNSVWLGFGIIKGIGAAGVRALVEEREKGGPFTSLADFIVRRPKGITAPGIRALILAGTFDELHDSRLSMIDAVDSLMEESQSSRGKDALSTEFDIFGDITRGAETTSEKLAAKHPCNGRDYEEARRLELEIETLGFPLSGHPMLSLEEHIKPAIKAGRLPSDLQTGRELHALEDEELSTKRTTIGMVRDITRKKTQNGKEMVKFIIDDGHGNSIMCLSFGGGFQGRQGALVVANGTLRQDSNDYGNNNEDEDGVETPSEDNRELVLMTDKITEVTPDQVVGNAVPQDGGSLSTGSETSAPDKPKRDGNPAASGHGDKHGEQKKFVSRPLFSKGKAPIPPKRPAPKQRHHKPRVELVKETFPGSLAPRLLEAIKECHQYFDDNVLSKSTVGLSGDDSMFIEAPAEVIERIKSRIGS